MTGQKCSSGSDPGSWILIQSGSNPEQYPPSLTTLVGPAGQAPANVSESHIVSLSRDGQTVTLSLSLECNQL